MNDDEPPYTSRSADAEFTDQAAAIDAMFSDPGLVSLRSRHPNHPAIPLRDAVATITRQHDVVLADLLDLATRVSIIAFDQDVWLSPPDEDDFWNLVPDRAAAERVRTNIHDPRRFDETLAEVRTWAHLRSRGLTADLLEENGRPDIRLGGDPLAWVEVKFLRASTAPGALQDRIKKANRQLRGASVGRSGTVYVYLDREPRPEPYSPTALNSVPPDLVEKVAEAERLMRGPFFKSIGALVLVWHRTLFGPVTDTCPLVIQRVFRLIEHPTEQPYAGPSADDLSIARFAYTMIGLGGADPPPSGGGLFNRATPS